MNKTIRKLIGLSIILAVGYISYDRVAYPRYTYVDQGTIGQKVYKPERNYVYYTPIQIGDSLIMQPHSVIEDEKMLTQVEIYSLKFMVDDIELYLNGIEGDKVDLLVHARDKKGKTIINKVKVYRE